MSAPVISFIGWSGSGKTTFIEKLIPVLRRRGLRLAVIKHDGHDFQMDREGKDTYRFTAAGAECVAIANSSHAAIIDSRPLGFEELCGRVGSVDLVIAEGWTELPYPQIEVLRGQDTLRCLHRDRLLAVITDRCPSLSLPLFGLEDTEAVADFICEYLNL